MNTDRENAEAVLRKLRESGHIAYFAGGCVRDLLLNIAPKDWDVATDAHPQRVREIFPKTQSVGAKFGVILVRQGSSVIEVATFRSDGSYEDGRHPTEVQFTTAEEDAQRRDFTINGLFLDPTDNDKIIDHVGGQKDLKNKILRAIGDANLRFEEDHLRMLRAVRFAARFGLGIEDRTAEAIRKHSPQLARISPERIAEELRLMLTPAWREIAYLHLRDFGLLEVVLRFLPEKQTSREETLNLFRLLPAGPISFGLALATIVLDFRLRASGQNSALVFLDRPGLLTARKALRQALRFSNEEEDAMSGAMSFAHLLEATPPSVAMMKRFLARSSASDAQRLMAAIAKSGMLADRIEPLLDRLSEVAKSEVAPPPLLTGDDLVAAGFRPGPAFKRALDAVYDAQLEDRIESKDDAITMARSLLG